MGRSWRGFGWWWGVSRRSPPLARSALWFSSGRSGRKRVRSQDDLTSARNPHLVVTAFPSRGAAVLTIRRQGCPQPPPLRGVDFPQIACSAFGLRALRGKYTGVAALAAYS